MKQARVLTPDEVNRLLDLVSRSRYPERDRTMVLLSFKAGLRAMEIAGLTWDDVIYRDGTIREDLVIRPEITKRPWGWWAKTEGTKRVSTRFIPIHSELRAAIACLRSLNHDGDRVIYSERKSSPGFSPNAVAVWFHLRYRDAGIKGASSHSGRRTFITNAARAITTAGGSLRDVQQLAGHSSLSITQSYIDGSSGAKRRVVDMI